MDRIPSTLRISYETARLELARLRVDGVEARRAAARQAVRVSAHALSVDRVGVWMIAEGGRRIECTTLYDRTQDRFIESAPLPMSSMPAYARALQEHRALVADDAVTHPSTRELADVYLRPNGITALLDAPIIREGTVVGVVCHEHVGSTRRWMPREVDFACTVADMVAAHFEQAERVELQAALQTERERRLTDVKMEALERMARVVAHDVNNLLASASVSAEYIARKADGELAEKGRDIVRVVQYGRQLVKQLGEFSDPRPDDAATCDLGATVRRLAPLLRSTLRDEIALRVEVRDEAEVATRASEIEQLVLNLCFNARDAIEAAGSVTVQVRRAEPDDLARPDHVVLEVTDTGSGMSDEVQARMFEPYFTTRPQGTGLGLAAVYGIVRRMQGTIRVASAPGEGTRIAVCLPRHGVTPPADDGMSWSGSF